MSSPVFDEQTGKNFVVKLLNSLLFGITLKDERNFSTAAHISASVLNIITAAAYIGISFSGIFYAQLAIAIAFPLLYFIFSFLARQRQAQKISQKLSFRDEFFNALTAQNAPILVKICNFFMNSAAFVFFSLSMKYFNLPAFASIFFAILIVPALRNLDFSMSKFAPINEFEPSVSCVFYSFLWSGLAHFSSLAGGIMFVLTPFLLFFGVFPQFVAGILFLAEFVTRVIGLQSVVPIAFFTGFMGCFVGFCYSQILVLCVLLVSVSGCWRNVMIQKIAVFISSLVGVTASIVLRALKVQIPQFCIKLEFLNIKYLSLIIGGALSLLIFPLTFLSRTENKRQNNNNFAMIVAIWAQIFSVGVSVLVILEYITSFCVQKPFLNNVLYQLIITRGIFNGFYDPLGSIGGLFLGGFMPFIVQDYSYFGLSITVGSWIFHSINRFIQSIIYLKLQCDLCFKEPLKGWQSKLHKARFIVYIYDFTIFFICAVLDLPALPIGGTPVYILFHPHHVAFFNQSSMYKNVRKFNPDDISSQQGDSIDKKDDIQLYNSSISAIFGKDKSQFQKQLKKINFSEGFLPQGSVQVLMSEKKMIFLLNSGSNLFRTSHNYFIYALETKETSCHTLERTCLERYLDHIKTGNIKESNVVGVASSVLQSSVNYTDPIPQVLQPPKRTFGITLGQNIDTTKPVIITSENRVPQNAPSFSNSWLVKYKGIISTNDFSTNDYSLAGVFSSDYYREELQRIFIGLVYIKLTNIDQSIIQGLSQIYQQLSQSNSDLLEEVETTLKQFFGMNLSPKINNAVIGVCFYTNFEYIKISSDEKLADLFKSIQVVIKNDLDKTKQTEVQKVVLDCFRQAVYYAQQQIMMGDEFAQTYQELSDILEQQRYILFSHPSENIWNQALKSKKFTKMYTLLPGPRVLDYSFQKIEWDLFHLPNSYYKSIWSSLQTDLLVFDATDDERFSVQSLPSALRNLLCEAAGSPFGYPLVEYGQGVI